MKFQVIKPIVKKSVQYLMSQGFRLMILDARSPSLESAWVTLSSFPGCLEAEGTENSSLTDLDMLLNLYIFPIPQ